MTLLHRRLLYISCILLFLILAPAISFYASGYEFDLTSGKMRRTGILIVKTDPKGASVNLGEKKKYNWLYEFFYQGQELKTPIKVRNLLPDEYDITLAKPDYFDYQSKVKINSGQVTLLEDISLFRRSQPETISKKNIINSKLSPDGKKLAVLSPDALSIIELASGQKQEINLDKERLESKIADIFWAPSNKKILLNYHNYPIFNIETGKKEAEAITYFSKNIQDARWDAFSDNLIYVRQNNNLFALDLAQKTISAALKQKVARNFLIKSGNLYVVENKDGNYGLAIYNLKSDELEKFISLPLQADYDFIDKGDKLIYLYSQKHSLLYLINPSSPVPLQDSIVNVREFSPLTDGKILFWNDFEIWLYDGAQNKKTLISRLGEKIGKVLIYPGNENYLIYNTQTGINVLNWQNKDNLNFTKLSVWQGTSDLVMDAAAEQLYFISQSDNLRALWRLNIK
ncbi:MAG: PEGA domain-containing protein [Patescibacteria group bacterium]